MRIIWSRTTLSCTFRAILREAPVVWHPASDGYIQPNVLRIEYSKPNDQKWSTSGVHLTGKGPDGTLLTVSFGADEESWPAWIREAAKEKLEQLHDNHAA